MEQKKKRDKPGRETPHEAASQQVQEEKGHTPRYFRRLISATKAKGKQESVNCFLQYKTQQSHHNSEFAIDYLTQSWIWYKQTPRSFQNAWLILRKTKINNVEYLKSK